MKKISFIYLTAFSSIGGIEKFNRAFLMALNDLDFKHRIYSLYDRNSDIDETYYSSTEISGFVFNRWFTLVKFIFRLLISPSDVLVLGHLNLAPLGLILKKLRSKQTLVLVAHGIDVWTNITPKKEAFLKKVDQIWAVSAYTEAQLIKDYPFLTEKIKIFPNTLDPFFPRIQAGERNQNLLNRYGIKKDEQIVLTVARLSNNEGYKGYDRLVEVMARIKNPKLRYLIVGKYDFEEKTRILGLATELGVVDQMTLCGFVKNEELYDHYQLADIFVMPSLQEGFGIVFIEALACGTPVIAGNKDGSVDALDAGRLGTLVNPNDIDEIANAINFHLDDPENKSFERQEERIQKVHEKFGFPIFKERLAEYLNEI